MKKNKTIAYLMAATLLVGGAFAGTKAWFSDRVTTDNGITIAMGTLDLDLRENAGTPGWELVRNGEAESDGSSKNGDIKNDHVNVRPGDYFVKTITVENKGSLDQIVKVTNTGTGNYDKELFTLTVEGDDELINGENEFRLNPKETKRVKLTLTPNAEALNNNYNKKGTNFDFKEAFGTITLTGRQINADATEVSPEHK